jgi:small GTP-binding protein
MGNCGGKGKSKKQTSKRDGLSVRGLEGSSGSNKLEAKIVLIGNSGVGKTSIALRYKEGKFSDNPKATVGASYFQKTIAFKDHTQLKLHIWDTGGSEKFRSVAPLYYKGAHAALVCYSIIDDNSFRSMDDWLK